MDGQGNRFVTPEAVRLNVDLAGLGSRGIAIMIDFAIQLGVFYAVLILLALSGLHPEPGLAIALVVGWSLVVFWGYFMFFEGILSGQTPGKRAMKIRVVQSSGEPITWVQSMVRNLVRLIDFIAFFYQVGVVTMLISKRYQRLGDLAAGTIVIHERLKDRPRQQLLGPPMPQATTSGLDTAGIGEDEYQLARGFLDRRFSIDPAARMALAAQVAGVLRSRIGPGPDPSLHDEAYVEAVAQAYRGRFAPAGGGGSFAISPLPPPPPPPPRPPG